MSKIALAMICKGDEKEQTNLVRALQSTIPWFDKVFLTVTGSEKEETAIRSIVTDVNKRLEQDKRESIDVSVVRPFFVADQAEVDWLTTFFGYTPFTKVGDRMFLFDEARNFNFSQVPKDYDWIMWMDCDDVLRGGENLKAVIEKMDREKFECVYLNYIYQADVDKVGKEYKTKQIMIEHIRERLVRNIGAYKWIAPIHETLIEQRPTSKTDNYNMDVLHLSEDEDRKQSLVRNLTNLELSIYKSKGEDPRHLYYLAKALYDRHEEHDDEHAMTLITSYLDGDHKSGWPQERSQACEYMAELCRRSGKMDEAIEWGLRSLREAPEPPPSAYINIALSYAQKQEWERALYWVKIASSIEQKQSTLVNNPKDIQGRTLEIIYNACLNLGQIDKSHAAAIKLVELFPNDQTVINAYKFIDLIRQERDITKSILEISAYLKKTGESHKIKPLLQGVPAAFEKNPYILDLFMKNNPPKFWATNEIAIFCGAGFTNWSPKRLQDPKEAFVGGSEEAVIHAASHLQALGWKVTVYADPGADEGDYEGVQWLPYYKFNKLDHFNIILVWRALGFFDMEGIIAKKTYLWCHDVQNPLEWNETRVKRITKAFFLSKWHRDNVPDLPEDKVFMTTNGI